MSQKASKSFIETNCSLNCITLLAFVEGTVFQELGHLGVAGSLDFLVRSLATFFVGRHDGLMLQSCAGCF